MLQKNSMEHLKLFIFSEPVCYVRIVFLGPLSTFMSQNLIDAFSRDHDVLVVNTATKLFPEGVVNLYQNAPKIQEKREQGMRSALKRRLLRFRKLYQFLQRTSGRLNRRPEIAEIQGPPRELLLRSIEDFDADLIYAFWGPGVFPELKALVKDCPVPVLYDVQSYPMNFTEVGSNVPENPDIARIVEALEGRLYASVHMQEYFHQHFNITRGVESSHIYYFSERYFCDNRLPKLSDMDGEPHIVHIGRTDFSSRTHDNITRQVKELANAGVHVHLARPDTDEIDSPYVHYFEKFPPSELENGNFANFLTQFDATVLLYNIDTRLNRFRNSIPSRFLFALCAGLPVLVRQGFYSTCEDVIEEYSIGRGYVDFEDLVSILRDKGELAKYGKVAAELAEKRTFSIENNVQKYYDLMDRVVELSD